MTIKTVTIGKSRYRLFADVVLFPGTDKEVKLDYIAEERLNRRIEKAIRQDNYPSVKDIDQMYTYFVPQIVADGNDEREIRESIEDVYEDYA